MTEQERKDAASKLYMDLEQTMSYLAGRWRDEHEYENIDDYATPIRPKVEAIGGVFVRMVKRPFGFIYSLAGVLYQIKVGRYYEYHRCLPNGPEYAKQKGITD